jgi:hypothetical protein
VLWQEIKEKEMLTVPHMAIWKKSAKFIHLSFAVFTEFLCHAIELAPLFIHLLHKIFSPMWQKMSSSDSLPVTCAHLK